jgi:hypothetical protein
VPGPLGHLSGIWSGASGSAVTASRTSRHVCGPITISPGAAACSSRAATLTASPVASRSSVPVTTGPVYTSVRTHGRPSTLGP